MLKTVSEDCNLACGYCYYSTCRGRPPPKHQRIDQAPLIKAVREYLSLSRGSAQFVWQGGEPLLAGADFFKDVVALQARHAPPNTVIRNALQTNGTLLNEDWARFFRQYHFLIGVSLDGPGEVHDARRVTATGRGTYDLVMRNILHLRQHAVEFNILTVLHQGNVGKSRELMAFYSRMDFNYVQFIPGMDFRANSPETPARYLITAEEYGGFLCETFDIWYSGGTPRMSVRFFDSMLSVYVGRTAGVCTHCPTCSQNPIVERDGDVFPCDFYMGKQYRLGNIVENSLQDILDSPAYRDFLRRKKDLPEPCRRCPHRGLCHGGCPRNRAWDPSGRATAPDYFCGAYRQFFDHAGGRLAELASRLRAKWLRDYSGSGRAWPGRNDVCICGSYRKFKHCCGPQHDRWRSGRQHP